MTADVTDVRQALKAIKTSACDHRGTIAVPVGHAHPRKSTNCGLMHTKIAHRQNGFLHAVS